MNTGQEEKILDLLLLPVSVLGGMLELAATAISIFLPVSVALLIAFLLLERKRLRRGRWWLTALLAILLGAVYYLVIAGQIEFSLQGEESSIGPGDFCFVQQGKRFAYANRGTSSAQLVLVHTPSFELESEVFEE